MSNNPPPPADDYKGRQEWDRTMARMPRYVKSQGGWWVCAAAGDVAAKEGRKVVSDMHYAGEAIFMVLNEAGTANGPFSRLYSAITAVSERLVAKLALYPDASVLTEKEKTKIRQRLEGNMKPALGTGFLTNFGAGIAAKTIKQTFENLSITDLKKLIPKVEALRVSNREDSRNLYANAGVAALKQWIAFKRSPKDVGPIVNAFLENDKGGIGVFERVVAKEMTNQLRGMIGRKEVARDIRPLNRGFTGKQGLVRSF